METKQTEQKLTETQVKLLKDYLATRLGSFGVRNYELKLVDSPKYNFKQYLEQELQLNKLGIFGLALKKCNLNVKIWFREEGILATCGLDYEHIDGGSNGCDLSLRINIGKDSIEEEVI